MQATSLMIQDWHEEGLNLAAHYKRGEARMVELLSLIAQHKGYYLYQCDSLKAYALYSWELPPGAAADMVTVANKAIEVPELIEALKRGKSTVSKLRKVCPVITPKDALAWIQLVEQCSSRIVEKAVAMENPETEMKCQMTYKSDTIVRLDVDIEEGLRDKLERLSDLLSTKRKQNVALREVLDYLTELGLDRLDPVRKAERHRARKEKARAVAEERAAALQSVTTSTENASRDILSRAIEVEASPDILPETSVEHSSRNPLTRSSEEHELREILEKPSIQYSIHASGRAVSEVPCGVLNFANRPKRERVKADIHHELQLRDNGQCTQIRPDGTRCQNRRWLHRHHIVHVADGGTNELTNLRSLCSGHHAMYHHAESAGSS